MHVTNDDEHFRMFAGVLQRAIAACEPDENRQEQQKRQLEQLIELEKRFREALLAGRFGEIMYRRFIDFICDERKQILDARPYFRERKTTFTKDISPALKARDPVALAKFAINFEFISFVMAQRKWGPRSPLTKTFSKIMAQRQEIVVMNMPLAINRARVFFSRTPLSHLTYMDLVSIAAKGLINGMDKYSTAGEVVPKEFRSTAMGRMGGDFIERYSETLIHFYPTDRRKLYRANKAVGRGGAEGVDFESVAEKVNTGAKDSDHETNATEIADIMAASSCVSADSSVSETEEAHPVSRSIDSFAAPEEARPDVQVEASELEARMLGALAALTVWERKILRLKGVR